MIVNQSIQNHKAALIPVSLNSLLECIHLRLSPMAQWRGRICVTWPDSDGLTGFNVAWADSRWHNPFCDNLTKFEETRPYLGWRGGIRDNAEVLEVGYEDRDSDLTLWIAIWGLMFGSEVLKALGSRLTAPRLGLNRRQDKHWSGTGIGIKRAAPNALRCLFGTHTPYHILSC